MILALIGVFEALRHWLLYSSIEQVLGITSKFSGYGERAGILRASASVGKIPLGYLMAISIGFLFYLQIFVKPTPLRWAAFLLLFAGLTSSFSRGPLIGAAIICILYLASGPYAAKRVSVFVILLSLSLVLFSFLPAGEKFLDFMPYIGDTGQENVTYRERLIENSLVVINRHPWFGSVEYLSTPEMESMRQGQGIIDIVNNYLRITLERGYVGLSLFVGFFVTICAGLFRGYRSLPNLKIEESILGRALLATLIGILLIIFTTGSGSIIPLVYWSVAGVCAGYTSMLKQLKSSST